MPSLLSYRFEQLIHENSHSQKPHTRLLAIRLYVDKFDEENDFYSSLLGSLPNVESKDAVSFPLSNGIRLILNKTQPKGSSSKNSPCTNNGQVELEIETEDLPSIINHLNSAFQMGKDWFSFEKKQLLKVLSPTGLLLTLHQKMLE